MTTNARQQTLPKVPRYKTPHPANPAVDSSPRPQTSRLRRTTNLNTPPIRDHRPSFHQPTIQGPRHHSRPLPGLPASGRLDGWRPCAPSCDVNALAPSEAWFPYTARSTAPSRYPARVWDHRERERGITGARLPDSSRCPPREGS